MTNLKFLPVYLNKRPYRLLGMIAIATITFVSLIQSPALAADGKRSNGVAKERTSMSEKEKNKVTEQCIFLRDQVAASMTAEDWPSLDRLAKDYIKSCSAVFSLEDAAVAQENMAIANNELGNFKQAISAADACIKIHYANPGCHLLKSEALLSSGSPAEARKELNIAEKLAEHALYNAKYARERSFSEPDKELLDSSINLHESQLLRIGRIRALSF